MNVLDLFSGIGGFSLGLERAGMRTVAFCERDEYCRAVLRKHWPGVPCFDDIHTLDADRLGGLGRIDLVCGGFPCQPFSVAGPRAAQDDNRYLWPEMRRVIALARPSWVIGENVTGLITVALDDVLSDLEGLGYTTRTFVIPAAGLGAPHRRDRLWIIAADTNGTKLWKQSGRRNGSNRESSLQPFGDGIPRNACNADCSGLEIGQGQRGDPRQELAPTVGADWRESEPDICRVANGVPRELDGGRYAEEEHATQGRQEVDVRGGGMPSMRSDRETGASSPRLREAGTGGGSMSAMSHQGGSEGRHATKEGAEELRSLRNGVRTDAQQEAQAMQRRMSSRRRPDKRTEALGWAPEPNVGRVASGVRNRVDRIRCLGNAVVPQIVEEIGRAIMLSV